MSMSIFSGKPIYPTRKLSPKRNPPRRNDGWVSRAKKHRLPHHGLGLMKLLLLAIVWHGTVHAAAAANDSPLLGVEAIAETLPWFDSELNYPVYDSAIGGKRANAVPAVTSTGRPPMQQALSLRLSRQRYPAEDGHIDAILRFDLPVDARPEGHLKVTLLAENGLVLSTGRIDPIPAAQLFFSYRFPSSLWGHSGALQVEWLRDTGEPVKVAAPFRVADEATVARSGRIQLEVPNASGAVMDGAPMSVGVPFPRGALKSADHLRLVDASGVEIPLQAMETAHWSRFGSVRWVLCDFTVNLAGGPVELFLEYGPDIRRQQPQAIHVSLPQTGIPEVAAGRLRLDSRGLGFADTAGSQPLLAAAGMLGGFVEHAAGANYSGWGHRWRVRDGDLYRMPQDTQFTVEQIGSEKVVLKAHGWYVDEATGERFCQFVNRYILYRDSPLVRIFHTWIFTGDGNRDRIRNMGWRFPLHATERWGFLQVDGDTADWQEGFYLHQHGHDAHTLYAYSPPDGYKPADGAPMPSRPLRALAEGGRASGVMAAASATAGASIGVQDFWQNFPAALEADAQGLTFYQWPRYGRPHTNFPDPAAIGDVWRLAFAHEGETLSFKLPQQLTEGVIYRTESGPEPHYAHGIPESVNAQGIAKTAEMWLYLADAEPAAVAAIFAGLQAETLRPTVDPAWMAASGALDHIGTSDDPRLESLEAGFDASVRSAEVQIERMGIYGKWLYGDLLRAADLDAQTASLYRTFRKAHWGWPISWLPYARSGDPSLLRPAQAATRMMTDTGFVHYVSDEVRQQFAEMPKRHMWDSKQPFREIGWQGRNLIPWAGYWGPSTRMYADEVEYLWHAWYLTGYDRARDVIAAWAAESKFEEPFTIDSEKMGRGPLTAGWNRGRWPIQIQKQYMDTYQATWDPWFLAGAQAIADMHLWRRDNEDYHGSVWNTGPQDYQRYSDCPDHREFLLAMVSAQTDWPHQGWANVPSNLIPSSVAGYELTGDDFYLRHLGGLAELLRWTIYDHDDADYYRGFFAVGDSNTHMLFTSWMQKWYPMASGVLAGAGGLPDNYIPPAFDHHMQAGDQIEVVKSPGQSLRLRTRGAYTIISPSGDKITGDGPEYILEADAEAGIYTFIPGARSLRLPVTPPGTPEVLVIAPESKVGGGGAFAQYWFQVPGNVDAFSLEFDNSGMGRQSVRQIIIWDPADNPVWAHHQRAVDHDPAQRVIRADLAVEPDQPEGLWRVTMPGINRVPFRLDPHLPTRLAHSPERWFDRD